MYGWNDKQGFAVILPIFWNSQTSFTIIVSWIVAPKRYVYPEPLNMTLLGIRMFAHIIKVRVLRSDQPRWGWALNPKISIRLKRRWHTESQGEARWRRGRDAIVNPRTRNTKDCRQPPEATREVCEWILPRSLQKELMLLLTWFWTPGLQNHKGINLCCFKSLHTWQFVTAALKLHIIIYI